MKSTFLKNFWLKIKKNRVEDILQILFVATMALIVVTVVNPELTGSKYGPSTPLGAYFDIFVRYGTFIFIYFTFIPVLILWIVKKGLKEKWNPKTGLCFLALSLFVLITIYFIVPGPIYGDAFFNIPEYESLSASVSDVFGKFQKIVETEHDFCEKRIDFFYSTDCAVSGLTPTLETIKNGLEQKGSKIKFYDWCAGTDEDSCEEYKKGEYDLEYVKNLFEEYNLKSLPALIIGCKYIAAGEFKLDDYTELICEKLNECDL